MMTRYAILFLLLSAGIADAQLFLSTSSLPEHPRLYLTQARVNSVIIPRWNALVAGTACTLSLPACEWNNEYNFLTKVSTYVPDGTVNRKLDGLNAALRGCLIDPTAVLTATLTIGPTTAAVTLVNPTYRQVAVVGAYNQMQTRTSPAQAFEFFRDIHTSAVVYDWCYSYLQTGGSGGGQLINPITGNTYIVDFKTKLLTISQLRDQPGWPDGSPSPPPNGTQGGTTYDTLPDINGHIANGSILGNHLAWGLAIANEDPILWNAVRALVMGRYKTVIDWFATGHAGLNNSRYYTFINHQTLAALLLRNVGTTYIDTATSPFKNALLDWVYALRPDGRLFRSGDIVDDDYISVQNRTLAALHGHLFQADPLGTVSSYWAMQDYLDHAPGTLTNRQVSATGIQLPFSKEDTTDGIKALTFAILDDADRLNPRTYATTYGATSFSSLPLTHYFPFPTNMTSLRTSWDFGNVNTSTTAMAEMKGGSYLYGQHAAKDFGTFQIYYKGPLTGNFSVYQGATSIWHSSYNVNFAKQVSAFNGMALYEPTEACNVTANPVCYMDGGPSWPRPWRDPVVNFSANTPGSFLKSNPDGPIYHADVINDAKWGANGYRRATEHAHWEHASSTAAYIASNTTASFQTSQTTVGVRATASRRSMVSFNTSAVDATAPLLFVVADFMNARDAALQKRFLIQTYNTPNMAGGRTFYWENTGFMTNYIYKSGAAASSVTGTTSPQVADNANPQSGPNLQGYFYNYRGTKYTGSYGGRLTVSSIFPTTATVTYYPYANSVVAGATSTIPTAPTTNCPTSTTCVAISTPLRQGMVRLPSAPGGQFNIDPGDKGQNYASGDAYPNNEAGHGRVEVTTSGTAVDDFLHCMITTNAGVTAPTVTSYDPTPGATGLMGCKALNRLALFQKGGGDILFAGTNEVTIAGANFDVFATVEPGTWKVCVGAVEQASVVADSTGRSIYAANIPAGALKLAAAC